MRIELHGLRAELVCSVCRSKFKYPFDVRPEVLDLTSLGQHIIAEHFWGTGKPTDLHLPQCERLSDWSTTVSYDVLRDGKVIANGNMTPKSGAGGR